MNLYLAEGGIRVSGAQTAGMLRIVYAFSFTPTDGSVDGEQYGDVESEVSPTATQAQRRSSIQAALNAWATARGDVIDRVLRIDGSSFTP